MKPTRCLLAVAILASALTGCIQPEKLVRPTSPSTTTSRVTAAGRVTFHPGQPCASQIMFDFRITGARSSIQLAAPMRETRLLTDAANQNRRVRIWGTWQQSAQSGCKYISVTKVEPLSIAVMF